MRAVRVLRAFLALGLPAVALALCTVVGLAATAGAHPVPAKYAHAAMVPAPNRLMPAVVRMHDPISFDLVPAEHATGPFHPADSALAPVAKTHAGIVSGSCHNRGPPTRELV